MFHMCQGMDHYISDSYMHDFEGIQRLLRTLVDILVDYQHMLANKNKLLDH